MTLSLRVLTRQDERRFVFVSASGWSTQYDFSNIPNMAQRERMITAVDRLASAVISNSFVAYLYGGIPGAPPGGGYGLRNKVVTFTSNLNEFRLRIRPNTADGRGDGYHSLYVRPDGSISHLIWLRDNGIGTSFTDVFGKTIHELTHAMGVMHDDSLNYAATPIFPDVLRIVLGAISEDVPDSAGSSPASAWQFEVRPGIVDSDRNPELIRQSGQ